MGQVDGHHSPSIVSDGTKLQPMVQLDLEIFNSTWSCGGTHPSPSTGSGRKKCHRPLVEQQSIVPPCSSGVMIKGVGSSPCPAIRNRVNRHIKVALLIMKNPIEPHLSLRPSV